MGNFWEIPDFFMNLKVVVNGRNVPHYRKLRNFSKNENFSSIWIRNKLSPFWECFFSVKGFRLNRKIQMFDF